jgi:hypothetical protein
MLMRNSRRRRCIHQLGLFHPPRKNPKWESLPAEARQTVTKLLAQMLRQHHAERLVSDDAKEASDE